MRLFLNIQAEASAGGFMIIREATRSDIPELVAVRGAVRENILTSEIPLERIAAGLDARGRGWVAEHEGRVVGFSMADREESMIWALFLLPEWEGRGLGRALLGRAVEWLWGEGCELIWLTTEPGSRAEGFYTHLGWAPAGITEKGEVRFELHRTRPPQAGPAEA
jgi:GNAT superfamily N-acetyltransferase